MKMCCPTCGSGNIQPLSVVHAGGTQLLHASHAAISSDGQFLHGVSHGSQVTLLAQHCAPPAPPSPIPFVAAYGIGGIVLYLSMTICSLLGTRECVFVGIAALRRQWKEAAVGVAILALGWILMKAWRSQAMVYAAAKRQWQRTWFCHGCGCRSVSN